MSDPAPIVPLIMRVRTGEVLADVPYGHDIYLQIDHLFEL